ncbi:CoA pyrophosphatase [Galactobacter valiniphilus]|uniref:CoA pyrophosphatase n=1 Tax=Galactobacter valiniphilus TaxID=2676122 RepID=A0A399JE02_9MICC|nr:CoA pyrophosphatase [Galactobacter valiniphilus]RII43788.1 CoA pyrophosphatase [Galactobacter valiniphilus]
MSTQAEPAPSCNTAREQLAALASAYERDPAREAGYARLRRVRPPAGDRPARSASVLVLFGALDGHPAEHPSAAVPADLDVLLVVRASTLRDHAGEIAFPGGGADPEDADAVATALREAVEETGLDPAGVQVLGALPLAPTVSNFTVTPVLGWWSEPSEVGVVDAGESAAVFRMPVADLLDPANRCMTVLERAGREWTMPAFRTQHGLLWGFTAAILDGLFEELGWGEPWDEHDRVRPRGY